MDSNKKPNKPANPRPTCKVFTIQLVAEEVSQKKCGNGDGRRESLKEGGPVECAHQELRNDANNEGRDDSEEAMRDDSRAGYDQNSSGINWTPVLRPTLYARSV
jgi:hypothetical protein